MIIPKHNINHETYKICSISLVFDCMCVRLPFSSCSIAGVPSSQALPGYLITVPPSMCVPAVIGALAMWIQNKKTTKHVTMRPVPRSGRRCRCWFLSQLSQQKNAPKNTLASLYRGPSHNVPTNTSLVSDHTYHWGPSVS